MSSFRDAARAAALALALLGSCAAVSAQTQGKTQVKVQVQHQARTDATQRFPGIGRAATPSEVRAWDIDVRPDFTGLPPGSGSVAKGQQVWEAKCASCHGIFGESNEVFAPIAGGTTARDIATGRVARLTDGSYPGRTTLMKLSTLSTLWDYINRAMPWNQPKSLTVEEVYAVTGYILHLGGIVPDNFTLSDQNIREVQNRLPNRNGTTTAHALWPGREFGGTTRPDVTGSTCMRDCATEVKVASLLPDFARNAHGNLAEQNRPVGPQRGADTTRPEAASTPVAAAPGGTPMAATTRPAPAATPPSPAAPSPAAASGAAADGKAALALANRHSCMACHGVDRRIVGPSFKEVAARHAGKVDYLAAKIKQGGGGVWGAIPMPPQSLPEADARAIAQWLAAGGTVGGK